VPPPARARARAIRRAPSRRARRGAVETRAGAARVAVVAAGAMTSASRRRARASAATRARAIRIARVP
jgi:hypothetical protein